MISGKSALRLVALLIVGPVALAEGLDVDLEPYLAAARAGAVGVLDGRAFEESRTPDGRPKPLGGTTLTLLPRSDGFLGALEEIKRQSRDSMQAYRTSATSVRQAREAYEAELRLRGGAPLVLTAVVAPDGTFELGEVPEGAWVLIATRSVLVDKTTTPIKKKDRSTFLLGPRVVGYHAVSTWLLPMRVAGGRSERVELTDRNVWLTGIAERTGPDSGR
ncbi:MAG: hypothetical protein HY727_15805 [Candidatus Rokubacteria bacterium]|nr:hypothetical protein [Candidatus Rokubacteria bacterium]